MARKNTNTNEVTNEEAITDEQLREQGLMTLSARIRYLAAQGMKTADIARVVRRSNGEQPLYQHVRNVLKTPLKTSA